MEQRIGSSSQPLEGAGFDPAFIPGLTSPASAQPDKAEPEDAEDEDSGKTSLSKEAAEKPDGTGESEEPEDSGAEEGTEGPVFEASDRRAKIVADARGVRLSLDEERCEFRWDEIGAVETESPRFGKRFTITVHTPDRRWYPIEIEATARSRFGEWEAQLDEVLDTYFEDDAEETRADDAEETPAEDAD
ncbi:hypothetical protein OG985_18230 [Streptomyces sp. NBC_00289]|uniref:hypothetical protein n=1 Tax=Streptomyces sp. NBC_00289 TaxID=2975703 RepID=UPI00324E8CED